jgi:ElaB/YqjD/DUF883 family membrane-anchored ribosome-binding protein
MNSEILTPSRKTTAENVASIKESIGEIARTERERVRDVYDRGIERAHVARDRFEGYVREKPVRSLLIAAGAGALLGLVLARRR